MPPLLDADKAKSSKAQTIINHGLYIEVMASKVDGFKSRNTNINVYDIVSIRYFCYKITFKQYSKIDSVFFCTKKMSFIGKKKI